MSEYGIQPTGFVRKPLNTILAEIERLNISQFGPGLIQTPQSPMGQLNGLFADLSAELWELAEDLYQSYDPDQAEGVRLEILGRIRLLQRGNIADSEFRKAVTNKGQARVDIQDISRAIGGIDGVTFHKVFVNETGESEIEELERGTLAVAVTGGDDEAIAETLRTYIVPGINTFGNYRVTSELDGFCRSMNIVRPIPIPIELKINVRVSNDNQGCPPPSAPAIVNGFLEDWGAVRENGLDLSFYRVRSLIESRFSNVEVVSFTGSREGLEDGAKNQTVDISFIEIAEPSESDVSVTIL